MATARSLRDRVGTKLELVQNEDYDKSVSFGTQKKNGRPGRTKYNSKMIHLFRFKVMAVQ